MPFSNLFSNRKLERLCLLLISLIMGLLFWKLYTVLQRDFTNVDASLAKGTMINLNDNRPGDRMRILLQRGLYFEDPKDIELIAATVAHAKDSATKLDNTGELNKKSYFVNADEAFRKGGKSFKRRVELSRSLLGFSDSDSLFFNQERTKPLQVQAQTNVALGNLSISGKIQNEGGAVSGVLVRLQMLAAPDSNYTSDQSEDEGRIIQFNNGIRKIYVSDSSKTLQLISFSAYSRTDATGQFHFSGLPTGNAYEVLPLQPGYQFGRSQGIEKLTTNTNFTFVQSPHTFKLFSTKDFNTLKKEKAFIIRSPHEVTNWFWIIVSVFFFFFFTAAYSADYKISSH